MTKSLPSLAVRAGRSSVASARLLLQRWMRVSLSLLLVVSHSLLCSAATAQPVSVPAVNPSQNGRITTGRLIVKYRHEELPSHLVRDPAKLKRWKFRKRQGLTFNRNLDSRQELLKHKDNPTLAELKARALALAQSDDIEHVSVEYRRFALVQPNDELYAGQSWPGNQSYLYNGAYSLNAPGAWDITTGSTSTVIAIIDTGVLANHPDLQSRSVDGLGYDFVSADAPDDFTSARDGDGRDNDPTDPGDPCEKDGTISSWHGTAVASVAAGNSNNNEGITGVDWNALLLHARALGSCGGSDADIIDAIRWSVGLSVPDVPLNPNPARVVNLSLGGLTECTPAWQELIDELSARKVTLVMAAGNGASNAMRTAPANCAGVITVGSSTADGDIDSDYSDYGIKVTTATHGQAIIAASNSSSDTANEDGNIYTAETGTSFSAALVSGAVGLMYSINSDLNPNQIRALLNDSATPYAIDSECDRYFCGAGILDLSRSIQKLSNGNYDRSKDTSKEVIDANATDMELSLPIDTSLFGYKDTRYFKLTVPESGLLLVESESEYDLYGYILDEDLSVLALNDDDGSLRNFKVAAVVDAGTYYIAAERSVHQSIDAEAPFTLTSTLSNDRPSPFAFESIENALPSDLVISNKVIIDGLDEESTLTVQGGYYSVNNRDFDYVPVRINNGDTLEIVVQTASAYSTPIVSTITVGTYSTEFKVTTGTLESATEQPEEPAPRNNGRGGNSGFGCSIFDSTQKKGPVDPVFFIVIAVALIGLRSRKRLDIT